ncbi:hypothetical protein Fmac_008259 [Flemingia macrophylla]|uniref:Uncharacterized protein n=1 Tax=Flemingia macrophylla TaxID=520843 RepID=A0ABD1MWZ4_9FABA
MSERSSLRANINFLRENLTTKVGNETHHRSLQAALSKIAQSRSESSLSERTVNHHHTNALLKSSTGLMMRIVWKRWISSNAAEECKPRSFNICSVDHRNEILITSGHFILALIAFPLMASRDIGTYNYTLKLNVPESIIHALFFSSRAHQVWEMVRLNCQDLPMLEEQVPGWLFENTSKRGIMVPVVLWVIWTARNKLVFE